MLPVLVSRLLCPQPSLQKARDLLPCLQEDFRVDVRWGHLSLNSLLVCEAFLSFLSHFRQILRGREKMGRGFESGMGAPLKCNW